MDGTVLESGPGVMKTMRHTLAQFGIDEPTDEPLRKCIGPPLKESFKNFYNLSDGDIKKALKIFSDYYEKNGLFDSYIYPGMAELFAILKKAGLKLYIASSKPEIYIKKILEHNKIDCYFDFVGGADLQEIRVQKEEIIQYIIDECGLKEEIEAGRVIMVGDRKFDIEGAAHFGIKTIGVLFGYGTKEELESYGAIACAKDAKELEKLILE